MNRKQLYSLLPDPDEMGQTEYRVVHNYLVDAINEWISSDDEDISDFAEAVMLEVIGWAEFVLEKIERKRITREAD